MRCWLLILFFCLSARGLTQTRHPLAESAPVCLNAELYEIREFQKRGDQTQTYDLLEIVYTPDTITSVFPRQLNFRVTLTPLLEIADQIEFTHRHFKQQSSFLDGEASQPLEIQMGKTNDSSISGRAARCRQPDTASNGRPTEP